MVCEGMILESNTIVGILAFPNSCDYWFWGKIMFALWVIIALILYNSDKDKFIKSDAISALGVSSIVTIMASLSLTLLREELDGGVILSVMQPDVFTTIFVAGIVFIVIWIMKQR